MQHVSLNAAAIQAYIDHCFGGAPGRLLALLPEAEKEQLPLLQQVCREAGVRLAGGIFPALLDEGVFSTQGCWLLPLSEASPQFLIASLRDDEGAARRIVSAVREALPAAGARHPTLFLIFDAMLPNIASLLDEIYLDLSNRVEYAGVNAGSETFQPMPCLFDESQLIGDGVLGILLPDGVAPALEHGFAPPARALSATSTDGNRVAMIDWRPAFDVYQDIIRGYYGVKLTRENFYQHAVHFPFGILRANGDVVVRIPVALSEDGSLFCVGEIPANSMLVVLQAPAAGASGCIAHLAGKLDVLWPQRDRKRLLAFYCAGRRMHLGADAERELSQLSQASGASMIGGAVSLGEIGSVVPHGYPMFHNATLVCLPWRSS